MRMKTVLYSNHDYNIDNYKEGYFSEISDDQQKVLSLDVYVAEMLSLEWNDFLSNLEFSENNHCECVLIGSLGLWHGRHNVIRKFVSVKEAILTAANNMDYITVEQINGHLKLTCVHHDGSNRFEIHLLNNKGQNTMKGDLSKSYYHKAINNYLF